MKTKIFCDTADYKIIKKFTESFLVQGFTTNPSLMRLAGAKNYENYAKKILRICSNKPISFEVFADDSNEMIKQGLKIKEWGKNVYVKIPVTNSKGKFSGKAIKYLSHRNVKLNITAVYTVHQTIKIIRNLNKNTKSIISIFAGRMSDVGKDPVPIIKECVKYITPHGVTMDKYREYLASNPTNYPVGSQDQDIFRFVEPKFYPRLKVDYQNLMAYRS